MNEGQVLGRCAAAREFLLDVLAARFGACDESLIRAVEVLSDAVRLRQLAQLALRATSLADASLSVETPWGATKARP